MMYGDMINIAAIIIGPIAAVVITRVMDNIRDTKIRRFQIFRDLMRSRAAKLSPEHVNALNLVEVEFASKAPVKDSWNEYMQNLSTSIPPDANEQNRFLVRREQLFIKLIQKISSSLGIKGVDITDAMISNYYPLGWQNEEEEQRNIRRALHAVLAGVKPLQVKMVDPSQWNGPFPPFISPDSKIDNQK